MTVLIILLIALAFAVVGAIFATFMPRVAFYFLTTSVVGIIVTLLLPVFVK